MVVGPTFAIDGFEVRRLGHDDVDALQDLFDRCADHFVLHDGEPAPPDGAAIEMDDVPAGWTVRDKHVHGIADSRDRGRLVALIESVTRYPDDATWFLGLLLVDPAHRGSGLGTAVLAGFEAMARREGYAGVRLAVIAANAAGRRFWDRHGFTWEATQAQRPFGQLHHDVHVLVHRFDAAV